jgi:two-component system cell cycle sensor histidine kinase/response regulator CckA
VSEPTSQGAQPEWRDVLETAVEQLLDVLQVGLFVLDAEDRFVAYRAGRFELAVPPDTFLGRRISEVFPPALADRFVGAAREARSRRIEVRIAYAMDVGASHRRYEASFVATRDGGAVVEVRDVSERARDEEAKNARERVFRALIERATDVLYVLDRDFVVRFWSPGATAALGWGADEAVGRQGLEYVHPDDTARMQPPQQQTPGAVIELEYRVRHKDGSYRLLSARVRDMLGDPDVAGIIVNARDVTEQRVLEARSAESQKLEGIGRLAGGIAHDFNNLLTVILGCGELLENALEVGEPASREDVREILGAATRARDLTNQLLAFARRQVVTPVLIDLDATVASFERMLRRLLGEDVVLRVARAPRPVLVKIAAAQLQQIVMNLVVNARDAMPRGGHLTLSVDALEGAQEHAAGGPVARLSVTDDGAGMSPEVQAHLFEPFFTTKPLGTGTGLGLATVYGIVRQHGGAIHVRSALSVGTTVEVLLPLQAEPVERPVEVPQPAALRGHEAILLVEDDRAVAAIAARTLRRAGHPVQVVHGGREALALVEAGERFDLVITDVVMPGMDGGQTAAALAARAPSLRFLFVSGYTRDTMLERGIAAGTVCFLPKPFSPRGLLEAVREALSRQLA